MSVSASRKEQETLEFGIRLLIKHPTMDPSRITEELGLRPQLTRLVGAARQTPNGVPLPGRNRSSVWSYSFDVTKTRSFFRKLSGFVAKLENHKKLFHQIVRSGGSAELIVELNGGENIGDVLSHLELKRLSDLKIDLGIEIFPDAQHSDL